MFGFKESGGNDEEDERIAKGERPTAPAALEDPGTLPKALLFGETSLIERPRL